MSAPFSVNIRDLRSGSSSAQQQRPAGDQEFGHDEGASHVANILLHSTSPLERPSSALKRLRTEEAQSFSSSDGDVDADSDTGASSETEVSIGVLGEAPGARSAGASSLAQQPPAETDVLGRLRLADKMDPSDPPAPTPNGAGADVDMQDASQVASPARAVIAATAEPPALELQIQFVDDAKAKPLVAGETWYIISAAWYRKWRREDTGKGKGKADDSAADEDDDDESRPGPIDSSDLADESGSSLRLHITEHADYELLTSNAWQALCGWHGAVGPVFARVVIPGLQPGAERIEFRPPRITLVPVADGAAADSDDQLKPTSIIASVAMPLSAFKQNVCQALNIAAPDPKCLRFWRLPESEAAASRTLVALPPAQLKAEGVELVEESLPGAGPDADPTLEALQLDAPALTLAVEFRSVTGDWPSDEQQAAAAPATNGVKGFFSRNTDDHWSAIQGQAPAAAPVKSTSTFGGAIASLTSRVTRSQTAHERQGPERPRGLVGLQNLGNTCFMNSALQCMSNTLELQQYFVSGVYKQELNADNPLGMGGALAEAFGNLLEKLWAPNAHGAVAPREFKYAVSRFAPQFAGYGQQDTQELLAFLLDGLHEDLNRILKKPYIEAPDWEGGGEKEMVEFARKQWEVYKARNDSVIVDLFQGQYRSTLVCPKCQKVSIKFDPFMYLTLPIPNRRTWTGEINFVPYDPTRRPVKVTLSVPVDSSFTHVKAKLAQLFGTDPEKLVGGEVWHSNVHKWYHDWEHVSEITRNDTAYFWELPADFAFPQVKGQALFARNSAQLPERYEKEASPPAKDAWAIMPVFSQFQEGERSGRFRSSALGVPFFVAIPADKTSDPEAISSIVSEQYARFAEDPMALQRALAQNTVAQRAQPAAGNGSAVEPLQVSAPAPAADSVAEIRFEGDATEPQVTETAPEEDKAEEMDAETPLPAPTFTLRFAARKLTSPMPQAADEDDSESIFQRAAQRSPDWPVVYTGGALVCQWLPSAAEKLLADTHNDVWGSYEEHTDDSVAQAKGKAGAKKKLHIEDCLDEFTKKEQLGSDDLWYCPQCKEFRQATKKFDLWKVPDILVVHLKRFSAGRYSRDKLDDLVDFPIQGLDLSHRVEGTKVVQRLEKQGYEMPVSTSRAHTPEIGADANDDAVAVDAPIYDLYAVDNHYGGLGGGHYTAYAKNHATGKWYYYDDSSVREVGPEDCKTSAAYLLFYRRRTARHIGGKTRQKLDESLSSLPDKDAPGPSNSDKNGGFDSAPGPPGGFPEADAAEDPFEDSPNDWGPNMHHLQLGRGIGSRAGGFIPHGAMQDDLFESDQWWPATEDADDAYQNASSGSASPFGSSRGAPSPTLDSPPPYSYGFDSAQPRISLAPYGSGSGRASGNLSLSSDSGHGSDGVTPSWLKSFQHEQHHLRGSNSSPSPLADSVHSLAHTSLHTGMGGMQSLEV